MAENNLTDKELRKLKPDAVERVMGDGGGLWIRVLPVAKGGAINFYYRFELGGKERRYNCGTYPDTSLADARQMRNWARQCVKAGIDPVLKDAQDRVTRIAEQTIASMEKTVSDLFDDWKRVYLSAHRKDGGKSVEAAIRRDVLPELGKMKAKDVRLAHVVTVIDRLLDRNARRSANLILSLMRQMFRHGMGRGIVENDPTLALSKKQAGGKETPVDRNLSMQEIVELNEKLKTSDLHKKYTAAIWLLLATGARVGELIKAKWADVDKDAATWTIPAANSKNGREHLIHLSAFALEQIAYLKTIATGIYLLAGREKDTPLSDKTVSKAIRDRIRQTQLKRHTPKLGKLMLSGGEWSPHDLRRTMASRMGDLGIAPHIIERCLNHVQQGIVAVYQRQEYLKERQDAFEKWGMELSSVVYPTGTPDALTGQGRS
jgi:integrase